MLSWPKAGLSTLVVALLVAACGEEPTRSPAPAATIPGQEPAVAEASSPLIELTISGIGTTAPTSSIRVLPGSAPPEVTPPRGRAQAVEIRKEILRTPWGQVLDFTPDGGWRKLARQVSATRQALLSRGDFAALNAPMAGGMPMPSPPAVTGVKKIPVIMFRYSDVGTGASNLPATYQSVLFGDPAPGGKPYSITTFYKEMSNSLLTLDGKIIGWHTLSGTEASYTGGASAKCAGSNPYGTANCNGIWSSAAYSAMQAGLAEALTASDTANFGLYDNDGPDGIPNSGDDDGFVDLLVFVHSEVDGACGNTSIWSHRSSLSASFTTNDPRTGGGFIRISSYTIQSGVGGSTACNGSQIMPIGTTAHETGHAFELPDLYDTQGSTEGIGEWGLMGSGNYTTPLSPSRMEAWSLNELGWITLRGLTTDGTYSFGPAPTSDTAFVVRVAGINGRKEYYFLENRQAVQSDTALIRIHCGVSGLSYPANCRGGLAIWHADSTQLQSGKATNTVNSGTIHGLSLVQSDAYSDLETGFNRGDAGDLWPGFGLGTPKTRYGLNSNPAAVTNADLNKFIGFKVDQITQVALNGEMNFHLSFGRPLATPPVATGLDGTIELDRLSVASFQVGARPGGYNYVSATYRVRNASLTGTSYPSVRDNLTFLGVITPTTLSQTAVSRFLRFDGSPASVSAATMEPTGAAVFDVGTGQVVGGSADILQIYTEPELGSISPIAGVTSILPYGFVVRNPNHANDRALPASPAPGTYDGIVTFAFRIPLQATVPEDPYSIVAKFLAVDDDQIWVTQSLQETNSASVTAIGTRRTSLGARLRSLSTTTVGGVFADQLCVRTAGLAGGATHSVGTSCPP